VKAAASVSFTHSSQLRQPAVELRRSGPVGGGSPTNRRCGKRRGCRARRGSRRGRGADRSLGARAAQRRTRGTRPRRRAKPRGVCGAAAVGARRAAQPVGLPRAVVVNRWGEPPALSVKAGSRLEGSTSLGALSPACGAGYHHPAATPRSFPPRRSFGHFRAPPGAGWGKGGGCGGPPVVRPTVTRTPSARQKGGMAFLHAEQRPADCLESQGSVVPCSCKGMVGLTQPHAQHTCARTARSTNKSNAEPCALTKRPWGAASPTNGARPPALRRRRSRGKDDGRVCGAPVLAAMCGCFVLRRALRPSSGRWSATGGPGDGRSGAFGDFVGAASSHPHLSVGGHDRAGGNISGAPLEC